MFRLFLNSLQIEYIITPKSPILIKSGIHSPNPSLPDMQFVRTLTANGEKIFIPGSSLKGVFRSFTEKVLRTIDKKLACDPFGNDACGKKLRNVENTTEVYKNSCYACKLYGNTRMRGRIAFIDAYPKGDVKTEIRYGVAISRLSNAVAHGPFEMEICVAGKFKGKIIIENFSIWQLGLLSLTIKSINDGLVRIGYGKNRGLGEINFEIEQVTIDFAKRNIPETEIWGIGKLLPEEDRKRYGIHEDDLLRDIPESTSETNLAIFTRRMYDSKRWEKIAEKSIAYLTQYFPSEEG